MNARLAAWKKRCNITDSKTIIQFFSPSDLFCAPSFQNRKRLPPKGPRGLKHTCCMCSHHRLEGVFTAGRTWEVCDLREVKVIEAGSAPRTFFFSPAASSALLHNTAPSVWVLNAWRSETFHFLLFLNALIDREYPRCQSKWASCPRLGGDCCGSTEASCFVILSP